MAGGDHAGGLGAHGAHHGEGAGASARRLPRRVRGADDSGAFKAFEAAGWSDNAAGYGRLTGRITAHVADALLDAAGVGAGTRALDVGCGRGDLCAAAAARGARVVGVDLADGMLGAARAAHPELEFRRADAEDLPFATASFDAALGSFVVNHLPRPERAAAELRRVLAPGGRIALAMWDRPERVEFLGLFDAAMAAAHINRALAFPPGPPAYRFADDAELRALLEGAGFAGVAVDGVRFRYAISDLDELWDGVLTGSVRTAAQLRALDDDELARVRGALDDLLEERRSSGGLELETAVKIARGVVTSAA
jgi:SAM-dependent methyltransferase